LRPKKENLVFLDDLDLEDDDEFLTDVVVFLLQELNTMVHIIYI